VYKVNIYEGGKYMCDINTIPETYQRLRREGYKISLNTLRGWVRSGKIPAVFCGEKRPKALISYEKIIEILYAGTHN